MSRVDKADSAKWEELSTKCFKDQAIWALNGFWDIMEKDAELVWNWCQTLGELHQEKHADGCDLDEFWSHKFLETLGETMTVIEMREKFFSESRKNSFSLSVSSAYSRPKLAEYEKHLLLSFAKSRK